LREEGPKAAGLLSGDCKKREVGEVIKRIDVREQRIYRVNFKGWKTRHVLKSQLTGCPRAVLKDPLCSASDSGNYDNKDS
jgi:hypothetical protein